MSKLDRRIEKLEKAVTPDEIIIRVVWDDTPPEPGTIVINWDDVMKRAEDDEPNETT